MNSINLKEIGATLARNKTRTVLTAFGIFWGTAMLTLLWGGADGLKQTMQSNFEGFASNSAFVAASRTTLAYKGYKKGMPWDLNQTDVDNLRNLVPEIKTVSPVFNYSSTFKHKDKTFASTIQGLEPNYMEVMHPVITKGRFINDADIAADSKVCVIGENAASSLFGSADPLGQYVEGDNVFYRIVGVMKQRSEITIGGRLDESFAVPLTTARRTYNLGNKLHFMALVFDDDQKPANIKPKIFQVLRSQHPLHPNDLDAMFFMDISEIFEQIDNTFLGIEILLLFVGFSSLIAGIIGVGNIMWIVVKERTKEFGIRRAIGAKPKMVLQQILTESAALTSIAGTAGICFAVGVLAIATSVVRSANPDFANVSFQIDFWPAIAIMAFFLVLGCAAGAIPAYKAMKIKPIEALNDK